ncbi:MAG: hypothetical protein ACJA08_000836 [Cyclobacteriaceae bacterium]|jgi:hypothetical protein
MANSIKNNHAELSFFFISELDAFSRPKLPKETHEHIQYYHLSDYPFRDFLIY